jgi:hypothetical protein
MCAYLLPEGLELDDALASHLSIQAEPTHISQWTFYDTFDGRLHAAGFTLRHGDGQLALVELATGTERAHAPLANTPDRLFAADLPEPLRTALAPLIEMRALTTLACVKSRFRRLAVLNEDEKTVVRLNEETADGLRTRVHAVAVRGYDKDLARVRELLGDSLGLTETEEPLADAAITAAGTAPGGVSSKLDVALTPGEPRRRCSPARTRSSSRTCPARSPTSTPSSCTICASPTAAPARSCASSSTSSRPSRWSVCARS